MASILKVDEMQGVTSAGDITITGEGGSATQSLQTGLVKCFSRFNPSTNVTVSSFNQSSRSDDGAGLSTINFTNNMQNDDYVGHHQNGDNVLPVANSTGAYITSVHLEATGSVQVAYGYSGGNSGVTWTFNDYANQKFSMHGDLA